MTTKKEIKNLEILLHVDESLQPISEMWWFQKKKARNLPKFSKDLHNFITFFLENVTMFLEIFQKVPMIMLWRKFFATKINKSLAFDNNEHFQLM